MNKKAKNIKIIIYEFSLEKAIEFNIKILGIMENILFKHE